MLRRLTGALNEEVDREGLRRVPFLRGVEVPVVLGDVVLVIPRRAVPLRAMADLHIDHITVMGEYLFLVIFCCNILR